MQIYVGTDISKLHFDSFIEGKKYRFTNDKSGHKSLIELLPEGAWVVMETTGTYGIHLAEALVESGFCVSMVNALQVKRFAQSRAKRAKTDAADAKLLTEYAQSLEQCNDNRDRLRLWIPDNPSHSFLKQLRTTRELLIKMRTMVSNQIEAMNGYTKIAPMVSSTLQRLLRVLDMQIEALDEGMNTIVDQHYKNEADNLTSIPGIAQKTCVTLIACIGNIERFESAKALVAFSGLSPGVIESGTSVRGHGSLCKNGTAAIRSQLFMCALSASRWNKPCKELYKRLIAKGKSKKSALIAIAHKLVRQIFAILKYNMAFQQ